MYKKVIDLIYQIKEQKSMIHVNLKKMPQQHPQYQETVILIRRMDWEINTLQKLIRDDNVIDNEEKQSVAQKN